MGPNLIAWDLETIPDLRGFAAANGLDGKNDEEVRAALGDKFPKHVYHSIVCIGALVAHWDAERWVVDAVGAPHCGDAIRRMRSICAMCCPASAARERQHSMKFVG